MAVRKPKEKMETTDDSQVYKRARRYHVSKGTGKCPLCPPHSGENLKWPSKSWKDTTKNRHQFGGSRKTPMDTYGELRAETTTGFRLYENQSTRSLSNYMDEKAVKGTCYLAVRDDEATYVLVQDGELVYSSQSFEAVAVRIDIMALAQAVDWDEEEL